MKSPNAGMVLLVSMFAISSALAQVGSSSQSSVLASGEVTNVDTAIGKVSIRHGPIETLGITAAGIDEFQAKEPIMLNALMPGDKVTFTADRVNGQPTIVTIVPPK
jgi:Cu(I)/Ag(I) efflux system periplasmic protein CusF